MLRGLALAAGLLALTSLGQATERGDGVKVPTRLTVGLADQLLGQLSPDGGRLYFVSTLKTAAEIAYQEPPGTRSHTLFDESADVTWPRVSPDGAHLAYISLGQQATGQLCVRELPKVEARRCLEAPVGVLQAEWMGPRRLGVVVRDSIQGDLKLVQVELGRADFTVTPMPQRNLVSPAFSPDGKWLIYVPIARYSREVGPGFAASTSAKLEAVRLGQPGPAVPFSLDAPGVTAQPVFSPDGQWLYFVQFSSDSDHDGVVDALDHGVLFRVPWNPAADDAPAQAQKAMPEQLSDGSWNCQYPWPSPARKVLVASCSQKDNVDVHELPLDGLVPRSWNPDRLKKEVELTPQPETQLLLYHRVLESEPSLSSRHRAMVRMVRMHLELEDFVAATYYAKRVGELEDAETRGVTRPLQALVLLREGSSAREHGRVLSDYREVLPKALALLAPADGDSSAAATLAKVVESEARQLAGDFTRARAALREAEVTPKTPRAVLELYHDRADELLRLLDDQPGLEDANRALLAASRKPEVQLEYALALAKTLVRGKANVEKLAIIEREWKAAPEGGELRFALELQRALMTLVGPQSPGAIEAIKALDTAQPEGRADRHRAILIAASERAADFDAGEVLEWLVEDAVHDVPKGSSDRPRIEQLFTRVMLSRAYVHRFKGEWAEAQTDFEEVAQECRNLEGLVGALDMRHKQDQTAAQQIAWVEGNAALAPHLRAFGHAWVLARQLGELEPGPREAQRVKAHELLRSQWDQLKTQRLGQSLSGVLRHEEYLASHDPAAAETANAHYLTALRLSKGSPRQTAMVLGQLGLLQLAVGNYRLALAQLDERERFPYIDNGAGLAVELARARALLHVGRHAEAVQTMEEALTMTSKASKLAPFRVLVVDQAALTTLASDKFHRALELYDELVPQVTGRNLVVAHLARAAAALGAEQPQRALDDLSSFDAALAKGEVAQGLVLPHQTAEQSLRTYRLIAAGLRANAQQALGRPAEGIAALQVQQGLLVDQYKDTDRDDDLKTLVLAEARLAETTAAQGQREASQGWAGKALGHADELAKRTGAPVVMEQAATLWLQGSLYAREGATLPAPLVKRLKGALGEMTATSDPLWRRYQRWFEVLLTLDAVDTKGGVAASSEARPAKTR